MSQTEFTDKDGRAFMAYPVVLVEDVSEASVEGDSITKFIDSDGRAIHATPLVIMEDRRSNKVGDVIDVVNNLTDGGETAVLSAEMGKALNNSKLDKTDGGIPQTQLAQAVQDLLNRAGASVLKVNGAEPDADGNITLTVSGGGGASSWDQIDGDPSSNQSLADYINSFLAGVNRLPSLQTGDQTTSDTAATISFNVLAGATDADGDPITLSGVTYGSVVRTIDVEFTTTYGAMTAKADGTLNFTLGSAARALAPGQQAVEQFTYTASDGRGGYSSQVYSITIVGTDNAPVTLPDAGGVPNGGTVSGNVLSNDSDPEGGSLSVSTFTAQGVQYAADGIADIAGVGMLTIQAGGAWSFSHTGTFVGTLVVTYEASDGNSTSTGSLTLLIQPPEPTASEKWTWFKGLDDIAPDQARIAPNPLTRTVHPDQTTTYMYYSPWDWSVILPNQTGDLTDALHFRVGPGMEYTNLSDVPWRELLPGDIVFVYHRDTPYAEPIQLQWARGDQNRWIRIIGVKGANGEWPELTGENAVFPANFTTQTEYYGGLISVGPNATATRGWKPGYIHIHGLKVTGVRAWNSRTLPDGTVGKWSKFDAAIYGIGMNYLTVSGCHIEDCGQASFINSTHWADYPWRTTSHNLHYLFNYFYNNGNPDLEDHEHTLYHEAIGTCYEYNWFDKRYPGSTGMQIKERSAGSIYRFNVMEGGDHSMIAFQDPDSNQYENPSALDIYGRRLVDQAYMYGNLFLIRDLANNWPAGPVMWGAGKGSTNIRAGDLHFYNNVTLGEFATYSQYAPQPPTGAGSPQDTSCPMFGLVNESPTVVHAYNNMAHNFGVGDWGLFVLQGWADFKSNVFSPFLLHSFNYDWGINCFGDPFDGSGLNGLTGTTFDPAVRGFDAGDYFLLPASPFKSLSEPIHADATLRGLVCNDTYLNAPFGAVNKPVPLTSPSVSPVVGTSLSAGTTINITAGTYAFGVDTLAYDIKVDGAVVGNSTSYTPQSSDVDKTLEVIEYATNEGGTTATTLTFTIIAADQPANVTAPAITGIPMVNYPITVDVGEWTNSPTYTIEIFVNSVSVGASYTPVMGDIGLPVYATVTATGSGGSFTALDTAVKTIVAEAFNPDGNGVWQFTGTDGQTLDDINNTKWQGWTTSQVITNNALMGTQEYIQGVWYEDGQGNSQYVAAKFGPSTGSTYPSLRLQTTSSNGTGYEVKFSTDGWMEVYKDTTLVQSFSSVTALAGTSGKNTLVEASLDVSSDLTSAVLIVTIDGAEVFNHTFSGTDVITGGFPGMINRAPAWPMLWWTDNPNAPTDGV